MHAHQLMTHPVLTCHVNDPLTIAAQLMWDHDCGAIGVVNDDGKLVGMLTDRDLCMAAYTQGRALDELLANVAMSSHVVSVQEHADVGDVEDLMAAHKIRRIPVVDAFGLPIGIITLNDLARDCAHSKLMRGQHKLVETLATICEPRATTEQAA